MCHYLRTDGVSVCLVMKRDVPKPTRKRKREQAKEDAANGGPNNIYEDLNLASPISTKGWSG